ncbi:scarecrow-like protein 15 isoform X2 [Musa acuminata AAA Group]|uniref:scarecrow-like protein 15 isoform X2 n=1 Tax=Musa acuminata AAA Group TaxID=214697 RepID=UPI0031D9238C
MKHSKPLTDPPQQQQQPAAHRHFALVSKPLLDSSTHVDTNNNAFAPSLFYEPTSVLDAHLSSSPATAPAPAGAGDLPLLSWAGGGGGGSDAHYQHHHHLPASDDWDSASWFLSERDFATAHVILSRLNHHIPSAAVSSFHRALSLFKEALLALLRPSTAEPPLSAAELVRHIAAHKAFADLSPVPHFGTFTVTQTLIEALDGGTRSIHLIDFDLGLGGQWSSFAQELAARCRASRSSPPAVRITAVVAEESGETALAAENLRDFARSLSISFAVNFVRIGGLGTLALSGIRLAGAGEPTAVVLTPSVFRILGRDAAPESTASLLRFIRRASPRVVLFVDAEGGSAGSAVGPHPAPSLRRTVAAGVEHFAAVLESVEATAAATGAGEEAVRRIERAVVRPLVVGTVGGWAGRPGPWREVFAGAGWSPAPFSESTESQAEWLVLRAPVEGYRVSRMDGALVLSWRGRELSSTSAWRC